MRPVIWGQHVIFGQAVFGQPRQHGLDPGQQVGHHVWIGIDFIGQVFQGVPIFVIDNSSLNRDGPLVVFLDAPQVNLSLADMLLFGHFGRFELIELAGGGGLKLQRPKAGRRFVFHLLGGDV